MVNGALPGLGQHVGRQIDADHGAGPIPELHAAKARAAAEI